MDKLNVYDQIEDFYLQDEAWEEVVPRRYVEDFFRMSAWQGASDDELSDCWLYLSVLCLYLGNTDLSLGDLKRDDFIDCTGWSARNVAGFPLNEDCVAAFLDNVAAFYRFLESKHIITSNKGPAEAKAKLLAGGKLRIFDSSGAYLAQQKRLPTGVPDLPGKVFFAMGDKVEIVMDAMRAAFTDKDFLPEIKRAIIFFNKYLTSNIRKELQTANEYEACFWEYFLLDYHFMLEDGKRPIEFFHDKLCSEWQRQHKPSSGREEQTYSSFVAVLEELRQAHLAFFTIKKALGDDEFECEDFFTGDTYYLTLSIGKEKWQRLLFYCHVYYGDVLTMGCVRGLQFTNEGKRRLKRTVEQARKYYGRRYGAKGIAMREFIAANPVFLRNAAAFNAAYEYPVCFNEKGRMDNYEPAELIRDAVTAKLRALVQKTEMLGAQELCILQQLWSDFLARYPKKIADADSDVWAAAVLLIFYDLNAVYHFTTQEVAEFCGVKEQRVLYRARQLSRYLVFSYDDPRYISEEGMLMRLLLDDD